MTSTKPHFHRKNDLPHNTRLTDTYKPPARYSSKGEKRRKPGKKLNLFGEENIRAQLLYSSTLQAAESYAAEKEAIEQPGKAEKEAKKVLAAENKQKKEAEAQEKALQRQLDKEVRLKRRLLSWLQRMPAKSNQSQQKVLGRR